MQKREPAMGRRASQCECGGCRACESESWVWRVGDLKVKGFLSRPMWYRRGRLRHVPTSPPTCRILNAKFIHPPKYLHLVVHVPGDVQLQDALHHVFLLSCTWELENGASESDPRRDEHEASIRWPSVLLVSNLYVFNLDRLCNCRVGNDRSPLWNSLVDMYANVFE